MFKEFLPSIRMLILWTVVTGFLYPAIITAASQTMFRESANGSIFSVNGKTVGSALIGQRFESDRYFWSRPSAAGYNIPSGGSNLGPTSAALKAAFEERRRKILEAHGMDTKESALKVPKELLFASASGVDPHIGPEATRFQIERVAKARKFDENKKKTLTGLVEASIEHPQAGFLGEPVVNVLKLNAALDRIE